MTKTKLSTRLVWHKISDSTWQAGGLTRRFLIIKSIFGRFSMRVTTGDNPSVYIGVYPTLPQAKLEAQRIINQGIGK